MWVWGGGRGECWKWKPPGSWSFSSPAFLKSSQLTSQRWPAPKKKVFPIKTAVHKQAASSSQYLTVWLLAGLVVNVVICLSVCFRSSGRLRLYPLVDFDKLLWCFGWVWQMTNQNQEDSSAGRSSRKLQVCTPGASLRARDRDKSGHFSLHSLPLWHSIFVLESRMCQPTQATSFSLRYHRT